MPEDVRVLRLSDMVLRRKGSFAQRLVQAIISVALRLFFRRIETSRAGLVPKTGALVFVLNHPNGAIDPGLVFAALPRRISFLAKSTLFRLPVRGLAPAHGRGAAALQARRPGRGRLAEPAHLRGVPSPSAARALHRALPRGRLAQRDEAPAGQDRRSTYRARRNLGGRLGDGERGRRGDGERGRRGDG